MTIKIDHINVDRSEDLGYWYLWALEFNNTFKFLFTQLEKFFLRKTYNIDTESPMPSDIVMWCVYIHALELYMKTYLLTRNIPLKDLRNTNKYGHNLEELRKKCAEFELKFDDECITWITKDLRRFTRMDWEYIKYPPKRPPLSKKSKLLDIQHLPSMYEEKIMIPPLDLLEGIVKPLVYIKD